MLEDTYTERPLFGGAISTTFPLRFQDVSNIRQVPDHQEVFADPSRDESLIFELLDFKHEVVDNGSAAWFLQDLANEQDAGGFTATLLEDGMEAYSLFVSLPDEFQPKLQRTINSLQRDMSEISLGKIYQLALLIEQSGVVEAPGLQHGNVPGVVTTAVGQMAISKGRQGRDAQNIVKVYVANLRLKEVGTDVLITAYEPNYINPLSESASTIGAGVAIPAMEAGLLPMAEVFRLAASSFKVNDWSLFGGSVA